MKKAVSILLIVMIAVSTVWASGASEGGSETATKANLEGYPIMDEPTEFTIFSNYDNRVFNPEYKYIA